MSAPLLLSLLLAASGPDTCGQGPISRAFDFWVGDWVVQTPTGQPVGQSRVTHVLGGCALLEAFAGADGEGTSLSTYSPGAGRWEMFFANTSGLVVRQEGTLVQGGIRFIGTGIRADGTRQQMRTTFTGLPGGRVRQRLELSDDGGRTWREAGAGVVYVPREESISR